MNISFISRLDLPEADNAALVSKMKQVFESTVSLKSDKPIDEVILCDGNDPFVSECINNCKTISNETKSRIVIVDGFYKFMEQKHICDRVCSSDDGKFSFDFSDNDDHVDVSHLEKYEFVPEVGEETFMCKNGKHIRAVVINLCGLKPKSKIGQSNYIRFKLDDGTERDGYFNVHIMKLKDGVKYVDIVIKKDIIDLVKVSNRSAVRSPLTTTDTIVGFVTGDYDTSVAPYLVDDDGMRMSSRFITGSKLDKFDLFYTFNNMIFLVPSLFSYDNDTNVENMRVMFSNRFKRNYYKLLDDIGSKDDSIKFTCSRITEKKNDNVSLMEVAYELNSVLNYRAKNTNNFVIYALKKTLSASAESISASVVSKEREINELRGQIQLEQVDLNRVNESISKLSDLKSSDSILCTKLPFINGYTLADEKIYYTTKPLDIRWEEKDYHIGRYKISIPLVSDSHDSSRNIRITSLDGMKYESYDHPHISDNGKVCWGNITNDVTKLLNTGQFDALLCQIHELLINYNDENPYIGLDAWHSKGNDSEYHCYNCGDAVDEDDVRYGDDDPYCRSCWEDRYTCCHECGDSISHDDAHSIGDGSICGRCSDRYYSFCSCCSEYVKNCNMHEKQDPDGDAICKECASDDCTECVTCGDLVWNDDIEDGDKCADCAGEEDDGEEKEEEEAQAAS